MCAKERKFRPSFDFGNRLSFKDDRISRNPLHTRSFSEPGRRKRKRDADDYTPVRSVPRKRDIPRPIFNGYQLVGDSLLLRFAEQVLFERCNYDNGLRHLGLCVSGQRIEELTRRIEHNFSPVGNKLILLIGTNNVLQNCDVNVMKENLEKLLDLLEEKAKKIVILTLPPIPKLERQLKFWYMFNKYNKFIHSLKNKRKNVHIEDISKLFLHEGNCNMKYFERWYDQNQTRPDLIHLNRHGLLKIKEQLCKSRALDSNDEENSSDTESSE